MYLNNFYKYLEFHVKNKIVLDCGVAGDKDVPVDSKYWVHKIINKNASFSMGIDYDKDAVAKLNKLKYNCIYGDCQNFNLNKKFDVIFAGELIEHLENQGLFLDCAKSHLSKDGSIIITTPNQFSIVRFIGNCFGLLNENKEHVLIHNEKTITNLIERKGLNVKEINYFTNPSFYEIGRLSILRKIIRPFLEILFYLRPRLCHQIIVIITK